MGAAEVAAAHDAAVDAALAWVERHGLVTRRGYRGVDQVDARGLAVAVFRQHTSRTADPQLHTHAVISSKVQDGTGMWLALDARWLKTQQQSLSWVYDSALRSELAGRLDLEWQPVADGSGQADLAGVPDALTEVFSKRSRQVEAKLAELIARWADEHDGAQPGPRDLYLLERRAVTASRAGKDRALYAAVLRADWQAQARAVGHLLDRLPGGQGHLPSTDPIDAEAVIESALERVAAERSEWLATDVSRQVAALLPPGGAASAEELTRLVDELTRCAVARCEELHPSAPAATPRRRDGRPISEHVTDRRLTTPAVLAEESALLEWATASVDHSATRASGACGRPGRRRPSRGRARRPRSRSWARRRGQDDRPGRRGRPAPCPGPAGAGRRPFRQGRRRSRPSSRLPRPHARQSAR